MANEKRLISVEKTVKELEGEIYWTDSTKAAIRAFLRTVPAVDAVEVVRCKDCKVSFDNPFIADFPQLVCRKWANWHIVEANDFCSYGERKDND